VRQCPAIYPRLKHPGNVVPVSRASRLFGAVTAVWPSTVNDPLPCHSPAPLLVTPRAPHSTLSGMSSGYGASQGGRNVHRLH